MSVAHQFLFCYYLMTVIWISFSKLRIPFVLLRGNKRWGLHANEHCKFTAKYLYMLVTEKLKFSLKRATKNYSTKLKFYSGSATLVKVYKFLLEKKILSGWIKPMFHSGITNPNSICNLQKVHIALYSLLARPQLFAVSYFDHST